MAPKILPRTDDAARKAIWKLDTGGQSTSGFEEYKVGTGGICQKLFHPFQMPFGEDAYL